MIKDVIGYEGLYTCDEYGNIFSCVTNSRRRKKLMKQNIRNGYYYVNLTDINGKQNKKYVHRIIAQVFIDNPNNYETVNHIDENKLNNNVLNLEWLTIQENKEKYRQNHLNEKQLRTRLTTKQKIKVYNLYNNKNKTYKYICSLFKISRRTCTRIIHNDLYKGVV